MLKDFSLIILSVSIEKITKNVKIKKHSLNFSY